MDESTLKTRCRALAATAKEAQRSGDSTTALAVADRLLSDIARAYAVLDRQRGECLSARDYWSADGLGERMRPLNVWRENIEALCVWLRALPASD